MGDSLGDGGRHYTGSIPTTPQSHALNFPSSSMETVEAKQADGAAVAAAVDARKTPTSSGESKRTPKSPGAPGASAAQERPDEGGYFSPKPQHYLPTPFPARVSRSTESSPVHIVNTVTANPIAKPSTDVLKYLLAGFEYPEPLGLDQDSSTASAASTSALAAASSDPFNNSEAPLLSSPHFPKQTYAALHSQDHPPIHHPLYRHPYPLRTQSSHAAESSTQSAGPWPQTNLEDRVNPEAGSKTAGNSPTSSPGLFSVQRPPVKPTWDEQGSYSSPYLHWKQRQAPKETHVADIDKDPISGRKLINQYEIIDELGRGSHGKVKLARSLQTGEHVAIKIVERFSKKRRLGKLGNPEEKVKKEVAILKKAHHPNVVRLEEVIDDPTTKKVYIILEFVENGEIKWRKRGPQEIVLVEHRRQEREGRGILDDDAAVIEDQKILKEAKRRRLRREKRRWQREQRKSSGTDSEYWSIEYGGDTEEEDFDEDVSRVSSATNDPHDDDQRAGAVNDPTSTSRNPAPLCENGNMDPHNSNNSIETNRSDSIRSQSPNMGDNSTPRPLSPEGVAHTDHQMEPARPRTSSVAGSSVSQITETLEHPLLDDWNHVPTLTLGAARSAFRDAVLGLEYLHFQGIIHRDIKPSNLLLDSQFRTKISDFGVSYLGKAKKDGGELEDLSESEAQQLDEATELAKTVGTAAFFAPELCRINSDQPEWPVTEAIDIWALGATLFCLVFGRIPFVAENEFAVMKRISEEDVFIPRRRLKPVHLNASSRPPSRGPAVSTLDHRKRDDHDLVYEDIDDELYDLLRRFLVKDPTKRITLHEVKHHPWVLGGITNPSAWLEGTDPSRQSHGGKIEVSKEDVQMAVVPMTIIERMRSGIRRLGGALGLGRGTARRAKVNPKSPEAPPSSSGSSGSATSKEDRRRSIRGEEIIVSALKASREGEHPLSQSVTASPEIKPGDQLVFIDPSVTLAVDSLHPLDSRPLPPPLERAQSNISTAGSVRTIRQSDFNGVRGGISSPPLSPGPPGIPKAVDTLSGSSHGGILGGTGRRFLKSMASRERALRVGDMQWTDSEDIPTEISHGEPSVAVSNAVAVGHVDPPGVLKLMSPPASSVTSPVASRPQSMNIPPENSFDERRRSMIAGISSNISPTAASRYPHVGLIGGPGGGSDESIDDQFHRAQAEILRRRDLNRLRQGERHGGSQGERQGESQERDRSRPSMHSRPGSSGRGACPPSPDDDGLLRNQQAGTTSRPRSRLDDIHEAPSPPAPLPSFPFLPMASSSSDERFTDLSQSTSYPSIPSVSAASSAPPEYGEAAAKNEEGRVSTPLETVAHPPSMSDLDRPTSAPVPEDDEGYVGDRDPAVESEDVDSDSDGDDFIVMTRRKNVLGQALRADNFSARMAARRRRETGSASVKSGRSGSGDTLRKMRSHNDDEDDDGDGVEMRGKSSESRA